MRNRKGTAREKPGSVLQSEQQFCHCTQQKQWPCVFVIKYITFHGYTSRLKLALHKTGLGFETNIGMKMQNKYKL